MGMIRVLMNDRRKLSHKTIDMLVRQILAAPDDGGFASFSVRDKAEAIQNASSYPEKKKLTNAFLDFMEKALRRQSYNSAEVDYTKWRIGSKGLMDGTIGICPICGRKGEISPRNDKYNFKGDTAHKIVPFFMGQSHLDSCDWKEGINEISPRWP